LFSDLNDFVVVDELDYMWKLLLYWMTMCYLSWCFG